VRSNETAALHSSVETTVPSADNASAGLHLSVLLGRSPDVALPSDRPHDEASAAASYVISRILFLFGFIVCVVITKRRRRRAPTGVSME